VNGICALCKKSKKLEDSHFMPKSIYRSLSKGFSGHGENIVWISGSEKSAAYISKQAKKYLLCTDCEQKFSRRGENKVIPLMARKNGFKLATKIKKFKILSAIEDETWHFPPDDDLASSFMYFAISIAWRLSATDWGSCDMPETQDSITNESMHSFSEFLLGKTKRPENTYLTIYVDNQEVDTPSMGFPTVKNHKNYQHIVFNIPGIKFSLLTGSDPGTGVKKTFGLNDTCVYFASRSLKSHPDYSSMVNFSKNVAVKKGRLARENSAENL
jgi:hypothetical protein